MNRLIKKANVLIEALPYIRTFRGKTVVVKYGGHAMTDASLKDRFAQDVVLLKYVGINPVIVHGGGPQIDKMLDRLGIQAKFRHGVRVTDEATMEIVEMVLAGKTNKGIVSIINNLGGRAVGLSGKDANLIVAEKADSAVDLGFVGEVAKINPTILTDLLEHGYIPVVSSVAIGPNGESFNVNADHIAGAIAAEVKATKLMMMTDVPGIYEDFADKSTFISELAVSDAKKMIETKQIDKGMIPKVEACMTALSGAVERTHIIDGTMRHSLLMEIFTDTGIGTMIVR